MVKDKTAQVGDLVDFHTGAWVFENAKKDYTNPGIVLRERTGEFQGSKKFDVYWSDGRVTTEYECYVRLSEESAK